MTTAKKINFPPPKLQIGFAFALKRFRGVYLQNALLETVPARQEDRRWRAGNVQRSTWRAEMTIEQRTNFLGLWSPVCGSSQVLWTGSTLEAAALEWRRLVAQQPDEKVDLTAYGRGEVASHREMEWRYGTPKASFACPICGKETPHEHTGEAIAWHRDLEAWKQRDMEKRWVRIEARIAELAALNAPDGVRACGSNECVAGQRDGVLCANGECDRENGVRPNGVATRHPRCSYPYCACVGQCFAASQPGVAPGVATDGGNDER